MILWHFGSTLVVLWFVFRGNTRLDYRIALIGSILPDLIDKPIGRLLFRERYSSGRLWGHALLVNVAFFAVLFFMRGRLKRRGVLLPIGSLLHLAEDQMWGGIGTRVFWWPLFGTAFPRGSGALVSWSGIASDAVGAILIAWILAAHGMLNKDGLITFIKTGRLEMAKPAA